MVAFGKTKTSSAFKLLAKARNIDFATANEVSKQISIYEEAKKKAAEKADGDEDAVDSILVEDYVDERFVPLLEEARGYENIILSKGPHPCAHLTYHHDLRREIGLIRLKPRAGSKEDLFAAFIDGVTADTLNYVKSDLLRVDVVKIIADTFKQVGRPVMSANELISVCQNDKRIWELFENGFTQGLNQCEREGTTQHAMLFKPKNVIELCAFIASIRPGFASMADTFWTRTQFTYGIKSLDELLRMPGTTGNTATSSFLIFDEQILRILIAAGFEGGHAYQVLKSIKKKKASKVLAAKEEFKIGFSKLLKEKENANDDVADTTVEKVWKIIEDAASYMFCSSHSYAYALDCMYNAYLKVNYPYEYYHTLLELYTDKGDLEKISKIIAEMKKYAGIDFTMGRYGDDNRKWLIDKANHRIVQAISSVKFISKGAANDLYKQHKDFSCFAYLYHYLKTNTCLNSRQIQVLIRLNYFAAYGEPGKLLHIAWLYEDGPRKIYPGLKIESQKERLYELRDWEKANTYNPLSIGERLTAEYFHTQFCFTSFPDIEERLYFIEEVEQKFSIKLHMFNVRTGTRGVMRINKKIFEDNPIHNHDVIELINGKFKPKYTFRNGKPQKIEGAREYWLEEYTIKERIKDGEN